MTTKSPTSRIAALPLLLGAAVARASEATGTEAVGEMQVSGSTFAMIIGAVAVLGVVIWVIAKKMG